MNLLNGLLGNATEVDVKQVEPVIATMLVEQERPEKAYVLIRDMFVFTNKRLIVINKQGVTGKRTEYLSIPYQHVTHFSIESAGHFDLDSELRIWIMGATEPVFKKFKSSSNLEAIQKTLASYVLNNS